MTLWFIDHVTHDMKGFADHPAANDSCCDFVFCFLS